MAATSPAAAGIRFSLRDRAQLDALAADALPAGLRESSRSVESHRDVYFDTPDCLLQRRDAACRLRHCSDGRAELSLTMDAAHGTPAHYVAVVEASDFAGALAADTDPARRLRALTDPLLLAPGIELEVNRTRREARAGILRRARVTFIHDEVTVRHGGVARTFHELKVNRAGNGGPGLDQIAGELATRHALRPAVARKLERAEAIRARLTEETTTFRLGAGNSLVVAVLNGGEVAVVGGDDRPQLPAGSGSGEAACRQTLHTFFRSRVGELHRVGSFTTASGDRTVEVWLVRRVRAAGEASPGGIRWVPVRTVEGMVEAGTVRDPVTVAAWRLLAGAGLLAAEGAARPPVRGGAESDVVDVGGSTDDFLDGPLSELAFVERVLALAEDPRVPLLERIRYVAIVSSNLDEFSMGTGGGVRRRARSADESALVRLDQTVEALVERQSRALLSCHTALAGQGVTVARWGDLSDAARAELHGYFDGEIFPQLMPRAITVSPGHPFPIIPALSLGFAVALAGDDRPLHHAYLSVPAGLPRFLGVAGSGALLPVEELVRSELARVYPDRTVSGAWLFRITRLSDLDVDEGAAGNLLQAMEEDVERRRTNQVVRVEVESGMPAAVVETLVRELRFERGSGAIEGIGPEIRVIDGLFALGDLRELADAAATAVPDTSGLTFERFVPRNPLDADRPVWDQIRECDRLVHHPYDDFTTTVLRLVADAASDPDVLAIRMTLYRAGDRSQLVEALQLAARSGRDVAVFVELKARFDEARNTIWVRRLEAAGVHVVYGVVGLKNNAKVAMIARREDGGIRRYVHLGTGNYNAGTARVYTDLGLLTADPVIGEDVNDLFNQLTGTSGPPAAPFRRLLVAPVHLLRELVALIDREAEHARAGRGGRIRIKCNGLADGEVVRALYRASQAGAECDLIVRGICTLRPGAPGLSERIRVTSILGRFLEHARIYCFGNAGDAEYFIGSADLRPRNLRRRIEVLAPIADAACRRHLDQVLERELADPTAWMLGPDGRYVPPVAAVGDPMSAQQILIGGAMDAVLS